MNLSKSSFDKAKINFFSESVNFSFAAVFSTK
jgi:hypothetical protein